MSGKIFSPLFLNVRKPTSPQIFFDLPPRSPTFLGEIEGKKNFCCRHHRLSQGNSSRHPPRAIPFNVHTPLYTRSIKFEPLRKKDQSADTNTPPQKLRNFCLTPQKKCKDQRMPMHTTPQKRLFQTPSYLVHRGVCTLNGMAPIKRG